MRIPESIKSAGKWVAIAGLVLGVSTASAHTTSIGSFNAGAYGSVTLVMGTYHHGGILNQGSITLTAGPTIPAAATQAFSSATTTKPTGLIDGVNNFYTPNATAGGNAADSYTSATNPTGLLVTDWQSATFTGLTAGTYTYQLSGMTLVNWRNWNSLTDNWTGTLVIPEQSVAGVPDGGTTAAMLGIALLGFVGMRRKLSRT